MNMKNNFEQARKSFKVLKTNSSKNVIETQPLVGSIPSMVDKTVITLFSLRKRFYVKSVRELRLEETERMLMYSN